MTISATPQDTKRIAVDLRKKGYSYSEIKDFISIPKSTLGLWLKGLKLSPLQMERVRQKRILGSRRGAEKKRLLTSNAISKIQDDSSKQISEISKRELWFMGLMLYWKNQSEKDLRSGVHFSSSNSAHIKLFLKWLTQIGNIKNDELFFDIIDNSKKRNDSIAYWSNITKFPRSIFTRFYVQKSVSNMLRIRVRGSSMLARQIAGWINGLTSKLLLS